MKKLLIILIFLLCICFSLTAQENSSSPAEGKVSDYNFGITASYTSETLTHPGFYAGVEYIPLQNSHSKLVLAMNLGFTVHFRNNVSLITTVETGYRFVSRGGFMLDIFLGIGYKHSWLSSYPTTVIYEKDADGNIKEAFNYGYPYLLLSQMIGVGWDMSKKTKVPMLLFLRAGVTEEYPYNNLLVPRIILSVGATYYFSL